MEILTDYEMKIRTLHALELIASSLKSINFHLSQLSEQKDRDTTDSQIQQAV